MIAYKRSPSPATFPYKPPLDETLDQRGCRDALALFRSGFDNIDIAWRLECTPAAAANGIAAAREQERARAA
jgi:hypothetical protein